MSNKNEVNKDKLKEHLNKLVALAQASLDEAEAFATKHGLGFSFQPEYGMGGYFSGEEICDDTDSHWFPSSVGC